MKTALPVFIAAMVLASTVTVHADTTPDVVAALEGMKQQMGQMQRTIDQQNLRIQQLESSRVLEIPQTQAAMQPSGATMNDADFQKSLKDNLGEAVPWLKGLKQGGDVRLRYESFNYFDKDEVAPGSSDDRDRTRFRFRLRWGVEKDFGDEWKAGFRLVSATAGSNGLATDNTSTNVTLGNPGYFTYKNIFIDRAFAQYSPSVFKDRGPVKEVTLGVGKFENPFLRYSTGIVWDADVTPEGLYEKATLQHFDADGTKVQSYWTAGQYLVNENSGAGTDAQLYGYQAALNVSTGRFGTEKPVEFSSAVSFYDYPNYFQTITSNTATSFLRTNTSALDNPQVFDFYNEQVFHWNGRPVTLWQDWVENLGSIDESRELVHEAHGEDTAWGLGVKFGKLKKKGDWELQYGYYSIGANAVVAAFNDSDFGGPGGTGHSNRFGHKLGLGLQLTDSVSLNWTNAIVMVREPAPASVAANAVDEKVLRSQVDLSLKF